LTKKFQHDNERILRVTDFIKFSSRGNDEIMAKQTDEYRRKNNLNRDYEVPKHTLTHGALIRYPAWSIFEHDPFESLRHAMQSRRSSPATRELNGGLLRRLAFRYAYDRLLAS
jgi:hypothetical protein